MSKKVTASSKTYQIRPPFKDKFRPGVSLALISKFDCRKQRKRLRN